MPDSKKILLTGGSGFIGRNILEQLGQTYKIVAPGPEELNLLDADSVRDFFHHSHFEVVIHAAGAGVSRSQTDRSSVFEHNTKMFLSLAVNQFGYDRLISLGSGAEYDKSRSLVKVRESEFGQNRPTDEYGRAKFFIAEEIQKHDNMVDLRCFGIFGKYEDYSTRFISNSICRALAGLPIVMNQNRTFDYVYVNDLVKIIAFFIEHQAREKFYNISNDQPKDLISLAKLIQAETGGHAEIRVKQPNLGNEYSGDNSLLKSELGNFEFTNFEQAIKDLVIWYQHNWETIDKTKLNFDA